MNAIVHDPQKALDECSALCWNNKPKKESSVVCMVQQVFKVIKTVAFHRLRVGINTDMPFDCRKKAQTRGIISRMTLESDLGLSGMCSNTK